MIMIPPTIDNTNFAEKKVFSKLKNTTNEETKHWIVYHSLNYPVSIKKSEKKSFKYFGEADFVILIPNKGIINIEVKGWTGFSCKKGVWDITKPDGTKEPNKRSPLKQASDSMFNIRKYIELKLNKKFPQNWMVVFTQCAFDVIDDIEYSNENIIDTDSFNSNFINRLVDLSKILKTGGGIFQINEKDLNTLQKKIMRPNFEVFVKTPTILSDSELEIKEYTDEQIDILNHLDEGKRILVTGSQGTGKTSIAEDILRREYNKHKSKILFLNSNRLACEEMKDKLKNFETENSIDCYTFNKFLLEIINSVDKQFLKSIIKREFIKKNNLLIDKSVEILKADTSLLKKKFNYDFIVFDEMQNCFFYDKFYDFMELILKDGLSDGKYCFLGDFKYQNLVSDQLLIDQNKHPKNYLIDYEQVPLTRNVRNSKSISRNAPILSGLFKNLPYQISKSEHGEVINSFCKNRSEKIERLSSIIRKLKNEGVKGYDIVILSNFRLDNKYNFISELDLSGTYDHVVDLTDKNIRNLGSNIDEIKKKECIYFSTAAAFQGLESKIVVYVDPLETPPKSYTSLDSLKPELIAFNAMGRATTILYLIWDIRLKEYYDKQLKVIGGLKV